MSEGDAVPDAREAAHGPTRRLLYLSAVLGGGTGHHLLSMMEHQDRDRWKARILSQAGGYGSIRSGTPIEYLPPARSLERTPLIQIRHLRHLVRRVDELEPDLLHTYFFWPIIFGRILKRLGKVDRLVENREDQGFSWGRFEYALLRWTRDVPDRVICVSEAVRRVVIEREGLDPDRAVVVHNGIELTGPGTAPDLREELGIAPDAPVVGMVANFNRAVKGVGRFLDVIPRIREAVPDARFVIFGKGDQREALEARARRLGITDHLVFGGYREDIERGYETMDVSVLTSFSEGLSMTLLESMRHHLPVVATDVGGNPEVVVDGETGFLVAADDMDAFVRRVVTLLRDDGLRERMGGAARRRLEARFELGRVTRRYLSEYEELLEPGSASGASAPGSASASAPGSGRGGHVNE